MSTRTSKKRSLSSSPSSPYHEILLFYFKLSQWIRGDIPPTDASFSFFQQRCPITFASIIAIKRTEDESNHGISANLTLTSTEYLDRLRKRYGEFQERGKIFDITIPSFEIFHQIDLPDGKLISCTYQIQETSNDGIEQTVMCSKTVTCTMKHVAIELPADQLANVAASTFLPTSSTTLLMFHESW